MIPGLDTVRQCRNHRGFPMSGAPDRTADKNPETTPEMIKAGQRCLDDLFDATVDAGSDAGLMCIPGGWAEAVYRAMTHTIGRLPDPSNPKSPD
jgi:hypothetical protein